MRYYELLNFQHTMGWLFTALIFMVVFGVGLAFAHLRDKNSEARKKTIIARYADGIEDRDAPYPLIMVLILAGSIIWGFFYIVMHGVLGVKI